VERMVGECLGRGGNAIIALRFDQSEVSDGTVLWSELEWSELMVG